MGLNLAGLGARFGAEYSNGLLMGQRWPLNRSPQGPILTPVQTMLKGPITGYSGDGLADEFVLKYAEVHHG